jgi:hypothetical protein
MAYDKFLVGYNDNNSGVQSNVKPWLITDNAFEQLQDVYILRGRVQKRFGSVWTSSDQTGSRLKILLGLTDGSGNISGTVPGTAFAVGQLFTVGAGIFTVYQTGTPGNCLSTTAATCTFNTTTGAFVITGATAATNAYFYPATPVMGLTQYFIESTGNYSTLAFDTQFSYQYDTTNQEWDYITSGDHIWTGTDYDFFWFANYQGAVAALNTLWATNFNVPDGIRYWNNSTWVKPVLNYTQGASIGTTDGAGNASGTVPGGVGFLGQVFNIGTTAFTVAVANGALVPSSNIKSGPVGAGTFNIATGAYTFTGAQINTAIYFTGNNYIQTAKIIVQFKNRLVVLNTVELVANSSINFPYRCRFSAIGSPLDANAWMQDIPGNGGSVDAPTEQAIVTAQFVKDRLIVYFESSTYELAYTGNQVYPFIWQKINNELGAVSTYSEIPFDKVTLGIDDNGIHACNGSNVDRIDSKIPQYPFSISNEGHGNDRVCGIRDYYNEMAYWTTCPTNRNTSFYFPNQVLVYNYINESWATINDTYTTFGYFFLPPVSEGLTWGQTVTAWGANGNLWNSAVSSSNNTTIKSVLAGNQEGWIRVLKTDVYSNAPSLQVTNFTYSGSVGTVSCINHNLSFNQFVLLENMTGLTFTDSKGNTLPSLMCRVTPDPVLANTPNSFGTISLDTLGEPVTITGTYAGGGTARLVSNVNILTKQYNFYTEQDRNMYLSKVDFLVDRTFNGQVTADYLTSSTSLSLVNAGVGNTDSPGPLPGNGTLQTSPYLTFDYATLSYQPGYEQYQSRLWHSVYMYADGECAQLNLYMTPDQMYMYTINADSTISYTALNDFQLHAMVFYVIPTAAQMR